MAAPGDKTRVQITECRASLLDESAEGGGALGGARQFDVEAHQIFALARPLALEGFDILFDSRDPLIEVCVFLPGGRKLGLDALHIRGLGCPQRFGFPFFEADRFDLPGEPLRFPGVEVCSLVVFSQGDACLGERLLGILDLGRQVHYPRLRGLQCPLQNSRRLL